MNSNEINLNSIPEIILREDSYALSHASISHNDLRFEEVEEDDEILVTGDNNDQSLEVELIESLGAFQTQFHASMGAGPSSEPPAPEFMDVSWANEAVSSQWIQQQLQTHYHQGEDLYVGAQFATKDDLINAVKLYHIGAQAEYKVTHSDPGRLILKCKKQDGCTWRLRASVPDGYNFFRISILNGHHTCSNPIISRDHSQIDARYVAYCVQDIVKAQLSINISAIIAIIKERYNYTISYKKAWLAKQIAMVNIFGDWDESYKMLPEFMNALQRSNPSTVVVWGTEEGRHPSMQILKRVFWAFGPAIEGFKHCKPVICVDGTHLYGKYKGKLMIAVAIDANGQLFPLAFAITEGESNSSWAWFMAAIREHVTDRVGLCVISDRHIGIINAMQDLYLGWREPMAYHRYCIRHLVSNFNTQFKDKSLKSMIYQMSLATQQTEFDRLWCRFENAHDGAARRWLERIPFESWTLLHDNGKRWGNMTTNMVEIFNSVLKGARGLPITALVQLTFYRVNSYFAVRREQGEARAFSGAYFSPDIDAKIHGLRVQANGYQVDMFQHNPGVFEVKVASSRSSGPSRHRLSHIVDLENRSCTCNEWSLYHYPCSHVLAACAERRIYPNQFVDEFYSMNSYVHCWAPVFHPIPDKATWPTYYGPIIIPNENLRRNKKGRPQSTRIHNEMDAREDTGRQLRCGLCHNVGHNRRSCPNRH